MPADNNLSVLVVEDSLIQLQVMRVTLMGKGFKVECAETLSSAQDRLKKRGVDVVMLDLSLPDSSGLDTLIKVHDSAPHVPIIVLTSTEDEVLAVDALKHGAQDYLVKGQADGTLIIRSVRYAVERQRAREALRESEERMRLLIEGVTDYAIFMVDTEGLVQTWNAGAERITGYKSEEILGKHIGCFYPPGDVRQGLPQATLKAAADRGHYEDEGWRLRKDGSRFWANVVNRPLFNTDGTLRGFSRVARDLTERKLAEETLRQKEILEQKTALVELLQAVTVAINRAPNPEEAVRTCLSEVAAHTKWNAACAYIVDSGSKEDLNVTQIWHIAHEKAPPPVKTSLKPGVGLTGQAWVAGQPVWVEDISKDAALSADPLVAKFELKSGLALPVWEGTKLIAIMEFFSSGIEMPDQPVLEIMANIGKQLGVVIERKELEEMLVNQAQDLARSNAELQEFAKIAAHDLQEPLKSVQGFVELMARRYKGQLDEDADKFIQFIEEAMKRMSSLIQAVLEHSKLRAEERTLDDVDLNATMAEVLANLKVAIESNGADVTFDNMPQVTSDRLQMSQLFQNLISNAIKFRGESAPAIHVGVQRKENVWVFSVRDNGIGLDTRYAKKIFGMFSRLHAKADYPGTGIGLAICKKIVENHGGIIWVDSQPGNGSTFYFTLPVRSEDT